MKDFLLIGNNNIITYKEVFPFFKQGIINQSTQIKTYENTDKTFGNHYWYTTLPVKHKRKLILTASYDPEKYPHYDNYPEAINVDKIKDIHYDYEGLIGVPVTIFDYDLDNVEVIGSPDSGVLPEGWRGATKEFIDLYYEQGNTGIYKEGNRLPNYIYNGKAKIPYKRVLIKKKVVIMGMAAGNSAVNGFGSQAGYTKHKKDRGGCPVLDDERIYGRILIRRKQL